MFKRLNSLFCLLLFIPLLTSCDSSRTIVNKLTEKEANEIIVYLGTKNIDAIKVQSAEAGGGGGGRETLWDISVPTEQYRHALAYLNQAGLPRRRGESLLNIFKESGLVPSEMTERIRYQAGIAEEIASSIRKFDGILDADVIISFPEDDPLNPGRTKGDITASIYVKHNGVLDDPNAHYLTRMKRLVESSVTGLRYDNITIIPEKTRFSEIPIGMRTTEDADKELVSVWSILVAKESAGRFRFIFLIFLFIMLLMLLSFFWIGWKIYPLMQRYGGFSGILQLKPLHEKEKKEGEPGEDEEGEEVEQAAKEDEEEGVT